ncbi:MAG: hypothetical protein KF878_06735 [Planctomycetes bacterium]|nr:hypothetical protein [Planctomycetota bacterium]
MNDRVAQLHHQRAGRHWLGVEAVLRKEPKRQPRLHGSGRQPQPTDRLPHKWRRIELLETQVEFWLEYR